MKDNIEAELDKVRESYIPELPEVSEESEESEEDISSELSFGEIDDFQNTKSVNKINFFRKFTRDKPKKLRS